MPSPEEVLRAELTLKEVAQRLAECLAGAMMLLHPGSHTPDDPMAMAALWNDQLLPALHQAQGRAGLEINESLGRIAAADYRLAHQPSREQQLEEALRPFAEMAKRYPVGEPNIGGNYPIALRRDLEKARAALSPDGKEVEGE